MGIYVNPRDETKEAWLERNGKPGDTYGFISFSACPPDMLYVCLIDNGLFTAAGIAFDEEELQVFKDPDGRKKKWYVCKIDDLLMVCPDLLSFLKR